MGRWAAPSDQQEAFASETEVKNSKNQKGQMGIDKKMYIWHTEWTILITREGVVRAESCVASQHTDHVVWLVLMNETHV